MMSRLFGASSGIASAAAVVGAFSIMSRLAGLVRDRVLLGLFGTGETLDVYYQAFRVPDFLLQLFVVGALSASFIPVFTKHFASDAQKAWRYTNAMLCMLIAAFAVVAVLGVIFAYPLAQAVAPTFAPDQLARLAAMMRVVFVGQWFFSASLVFGSVLQGAKRFVIYSIAPIVNNVGIILGALFFTPLLGVMGLAWGAVLGAVLHAAVQALGVWALGYRFSVQPFWRDRDVRHTVVQMGPRVLGLAVGQVNMLVMSVIASTLAAGSITVLTLAYQVNFLPIGILAVSYAIAAYPALCAKAQVDDGDGFRRIFSDAVRQVLLCMVPATVVFLLLRAQIVRVLFGAPGFSWDATIVTAHAVGYFALSFFAQALVFLLVRAYFALDDTKTPLLAAVLAAVVNVVGAWMLVDAMGVAGLGLAFSLAAIFQAALLWALLRLRLGSLDEARILRSVAVFSIAGVAAGSAMQVVKYQFVRLWELTTFWGVFAQAVVAGAVGIVVYAGIAALFGSPELAVVWGSMRRKLLRAAKPTETV